MRQVNELQMTSHMHTVRIDEAMVKESNCASICSHAHLRIHIFSGPAASSRLRLFEVTPCHVMVFA